MKILSFNYKGFANQPKKLAFRRLLTSTQLHIIFLQETLSPAITLISTLNSWLPNWTFHALDASGRSGCIAIGFCNKSMDLRNIWGGRGFMGMDIFSRSLESEICVMNVYGPCMDRATFWRSLLNSHLMQDDNIILGGDLNFALGFSESWGHSAQVDGLSDTISALLEQHQWVDIPSARIQYTWSNNRSGDHSLARRLERFLIKEAFLTSLSRIRQWVGTGGISDHRPILLELADTSQKIKSPFNFNASWLKDPSYIQLEAELAISSFEDSSNGTFLSQEHKDLYSSLVLKRSHIPKEREESWRLRSRAIWLTEGDNNTKFFHKFANGRKAINTIWELHNAQGQLATTQQDLARLANEHFCNIYKAPRDVNILEIMGVEKHFPRFAQQEDWENLTMEVTKEELEVTLKWFKKDKSPGPDGWTIEFYIDFFDILGDDLLKIVEDCRKNGKLPSAIKSTFIALILKSDLPSSFNDF
eukprot:PITA_04777